MSVQEQSLVAARTQAQVRSRRREGPSPWGSIGRYVAVVIVVFISLAPLFWTFVTSVSGVAIDTARGTFSLNKLDFSTYTQLFTNPSYNFFLQDLRNSAIIAVVTTFLALLFGILCAYALGRMKFMGKGGVLAIILSVQMFPFIAMVGPLFLLFRRNGVLPLYNTYGALIISDLVITLPLTVWFLTSFFRDLPADLEEAARVDGASRLQALWKIIVPLTAPGVFASAILSFIAVWNDFLFGLALTADTSSQPVTVGMQGFTTEHATLYGELAAAAIVVTIPLVIVVLFLQKRIVSGLTAGAVKG